MVYHSDPGNCLGRDAFKGEQFYVFRGCTYGCISDGVALAKSDDRFAEFFEFPADAIEYLP
jgi:hypothetical protein